MAHYLLKNYEPDYSVEKTQILAQQTEIFKDTARNSHDHDFFEFVLVEEGNAIHVINDGCCVVGRGSLALIRPSDRHCFMSYESNIYKMFCVRFSVGVFDELAAFIGDDARTLLEPELPVCVAIATERLEYLVSRLRQIDAMAVCALRGANVRSLIAEVMLELLRPESSVGVIPAWMNSLLRELGRCSEDIGRLDSVLDSVSVSKEHLCRSFRRYLGVTPSQYLNSIRIRHAGYLLEVTEREILDICGEVGFDNVSWFYRQFDRYFHMSPGEYRKFCRNNLRTKENPK